MKTMSFKLPKESVKTSNDNLILKTGKNEVVLGDKNELFCLSDKKEIYCSEQKPILKEKKEVDPDSLEEELDELET